MSSLEALGIMPGHDVYHRMMIDLDKLPSDAFFEQANDLVGKASAVVLEEVIPRLEDYPGRWNPAGFIVIPLGVHDKLGSLRLHIYPKDLPKKTEVGPDIHNHGWHLYSRVLIGHYRDTLYFPEAQGVITEDDFSLTEKGLLRLFRVKANTQGKDVLVTDGSVVNPVPLLDREVPQGQFHTIEAISVYHLTNIPEDQLTVTLVLDSPAFVDSTNVLINSTGLQVDKRGDGKTEIVRSRRSLDQATALFVKSQLLVSI